MARSTMRKWILVLFLALLAAAGAQAANIEQTMTAEEFRAAGLDKLSAEELVQLNLWLARRGDGDRAPSFAETPALPTPAPVDDGPPIAAKYRKPDADGKSAMTGSEVHSRLVGYFEGWRKGSIFKLENGQHWRVIDDSRYEVSSMEAPEIHIKAGFVGSWLLQVADYNRKVRVQRIK